MRPSFNLRAIEQTTHIDNVLDLFTDAIRTSDHTEFLVSTYKDQDVRSQLKDRRSASYRSRYKAFLSDEVIANGGFDLINKYANSSNRAQKVLENQISHERRSPMWHQVTRYSVLNVGFVS